MARLSRLLPLLCMALAQLCAQAPQPDVRQATDAVDARYNRLQTLTADFTESYRGAGIQRHESGKVELKKPGKMRWSYSVPMPKLFVSDGKEAWFYVPGERQARKERIKELDDFRSPLRFLLGKTKLNKEFEQLTIISSLDGVITLRGVPKAMRDRVDQVTFRLNAGFQIVGMLIDEADGSQTEFRFSSIVENATIPDREFGFSPPAGVEVVSQ